MFWVVRDSGDPNTTTMQHARHLQTRDAIQADDDRDRSTVWALGDGFDFHSGLRPAAMIGQGRLAGAQV